LATISLITAKVGQVQIYRSNTSLYVNIKLTELHVGLCSIKAAKLTAMKMDY